MSSVFIGILRPFTSIEASSTTSGPDLRGLAREDVIFPNTVVPAFSTTFPFTETSCAIFASKLLPTTACELIRLTVLTVSVVPAGIVAPFKDEATTQAQHMTINPMNLFSIILFKKLIDGLCLSGSFVRWLGSSNRRGLHWRVNQLEDHSRDNTAGEVS
jgi:hypothetical protein